MQENSQLETLLQKAEKEHNTGKTSQALRTIDRLIKNTDKEKSEQNARFLSRVYLLKGKIFLDKNQWTESIKIYQKALDFANMENDALSKFEALNGIARSLWRLGKFKAATELLTESTLLLSELQNELQNSNLLGTVNINLGNVYLSMGDYNRAIRQYNIGITHLESQESQEAQDSHFELARAYNNLGEAYKLSDNISEGIKFYEKALEFAELSSNERIRGYAMENLAECYLKIGLPEKALDFAKKALKYFQSINDKMMVATTFMAFGMIYATLKNNRLSREYFSRSITLLKKCNARLELADVYITYARTLRTMNRHTKAMQNYRKALQILKKINAVQRFQLIQKEFSEIYKFKS